MSSISVDNLKITAELMSGFVSFDPWSPALDGILAYWYFHERDGEEAFALNQAFPQVMETADNLPLLKINPGNDWWYACSSPIYDTVAEVRKHYHRRFDFAHAEQYLDPNIKRVQTACGAYKNYRKGLIQHVTPRVEWHCIGDAAEIERLLLNCTHIGFGKAQGHGQVKTWRVDAGGDTLLAKFHRPIPRHYAARYCGDCGEVMEMWWGYRPCMRVKANQTMCVMPGVSGRLGDFYVDA